MASLAYDEISLIVKYTQPSANQHLKQPEGHDFDLLAEWIQKHHGNKELLSEALGLYTMELELRKQKPIDTEPFPGFIASHLHKECLKVKDLLLSTVNCCSAPQFTTMQMLLKHHGLPACIPTLEKIYKRYHTFIKALSAFNAGLSAVELEEIEDFSPFWGQLVIKRLFPESKSPVRFNLPADVKQQAELYLDPKRALLLYKFKADQMRPDQRHSFGELSTVQKWAKKLSTRLLASAMLGLGSFERLPSELSIAQMVNLEVRDAAKTANFQQYEPISGEFDKHVQFSVGVRRSLDIFSAKGRIESLWIFKQLPSNGEFTTEHAGMIFGLGLTRALQSFTSVDAYELLSAGHEDSSAALILGMAMSHQGTGHEIKFLASMIGVHLPGYLPDIDGQRPQLAQIPLSNQVAAALALGYLFKGTADKRVSNVLFKELSRRGPLSSKSRILYSPAYTVACGLAFGLVNEGHFAEDAPEEQVEALLDQINSADDHAVPSAFFALLSMYSGTGDRHVASRILVNHEPEERTKPLFLFLRYLLRALISGSFPADVLAIMKSLKHALDSVPGKWDLDTPVASWTHILAAYAIYLAVFCAGTAGSKTSDQLRAIYNLVDKSSCDIGSHMPFAERYRQKNLAFLKDMLLLAMSIVNSGTGDKGTFIIIRSSFLSLLDECPSRAYLHHLALGFLLLGDGKHQLGTDQCRNPSAIVGLMASIWASFEFPFMEDDHFASQHMQWLWIFAVQPRNPTTSALSPEIESPEDLFLSERPSRQKFYQRISGQPDLYSELSPCDAEFLSSFYACLADRCGADLTSDILALSAYCK